jgi:hypothetical protein
MCWLAEDAFRPFCTGLDAAVRGALPQVLAFVLKACLNFYTGFKLVNIKAMKEL